MSWRSWHDHLQHTHHTFDSRLATTSGVLSAPSQRCCTRDGLSLTSTQPAKVHIPGYSAFEQIQCTLEKRAARVLRSNDISSDCTHTDQRDGSHQCTTRPAFPNNTTGIATAVCKGTHRGSLHMHTSNTACSRRRTGHDRKVQVLVTFLGEWVSFDAACTRRAAVLVGCDLQSAGSMASLLTDCYQLHEGSVFWQAAVPSLHSTRSACKGAH